jgi:hypothetical protein
MKLPSNNLVTNILKLRRTTTDRNVLKVRSFTEFRQSIWLVWITVFWDVTVCSKLHSASPQ